MDYRILLQKENDAVRERYELSMERIRSMDTEEMGLPYGCYFKKVSAFIRGIERLAKRVEETGLNGEEGLEGTSLTLEALQEEAGHSFEERKRNAREEGERAGTRLLLPMMMMLAVVMVLILVPACFSFAGM